MSKELTFVIGAEGEFISFNALKNVIAKVEDVLKHADNAAYGRGGHEPWRVVSLNSSSPTFTVAPTRDDNASVELLADGLAALSRGDEEPPRRFTEPLLESLRKLRSLYRGKHSVQSIDLQVDGLKTARIEANIAEQVDKMLSSGFVSYGTIDGTLEAINIHSSRKATIWDRVTRAPMSWTFPEGRLEEVKALLGKRVWIGGTVHCFANGAPRYITDVTYLEDKTPVDDGTRNLRGSIPDERVKKMGSVAFLKAIWEKGRV